MKKENYVSVDIATLIENEEEANIMINEALLTGDIPHIKSVINTVLRFKNTTKLAKEAGLSRQTIYEALSEKGNPSIASFFAIVRALKANPA